MSEQAAQPKWIDNHCHFDPQDDVEALTAEALAAGVVGLICVGTDMDTSRRCLETANAHRGIWATAGVHPHEAASGIDGLAALVERGMPHGLVAVGECGLDFFYDHSPRDVQAGVFGEQIDLANEYDLPLVIHTREAWDETFGVLDHHGIPTRTVFHCFTGGPDEARECVERGARLSISGIVTFNSAENIREAVEAVGPTPLMVETDSPFLSPVPHRGKRNTPGRVAVVGEACAEVLGIDVLDFAEAVMETTRTFYALPEVTLTAVTTEDPV